MTTTSHANPKRNDPLANPAKYGLGALVCCGLWQFKGAASRFIDKHIEGNIANDAYMGTYTARKG